MQTKLFWISAALALAGTALAAGCSLRSAQGDPVVARAEGQVQAQFKRGQLPIRVYEGRIKDVRPAWGYLILTVGTGKEARDIKFNMSEARIVGLSGSEWKGQDLWVGDRVRVEMTDDGRLVRQISVLDD